MDDGDKTPAEEKYGQEDEESKTSPNLNINENGSDRNAESSDSEQKVREKRQRLTMPSSPLGGMMFPGVPPSPPKFVSLEQIMKAANGVSNMVLAHEIAVNKDFKLEKMEPPELSLQGQVKEIVHKAFWDVLESELKEVPPSYTKAMVLLKDVKEGLLSLLLPHHTRLRTQINEVLDLDLIQQQAEHEVFDFQHYAQYILSVMSRLCAPVRDDKIRALMTTTDVVPLFKGITEMLDLMKLDMANFTIQQIRPHIQQQSIEYERKKFQEFLETQTELAENMDGLEYTRQWLTRSYQKIAPSQEESDQANEGTKTPPPFAKVLIKAYMEILEWNDKNLFPETLLIDQGRFLALRDQIYQATLIASILLVTYNTVGGRIQGISTFKETLKSHLVILLEGVEQCGDSEIQNKMESVAEQVIQETKECLAKHSSGDLEKSQEEILRGQIKDISSPDHPVYKLIKNRILMFVEEATGSTVASPIKVPAGLSTLQTELSCTTGQFLRLISHNRAVFGEYYADIINTLRHTEEEKCSRKEGDKI